MAETASNCNGQLTIMFVLTVVFNVLSSKLKINHEKLLINLFNYLI